MGFRSEIDELHEKKAFVKRIAQTDAAILGQFASENGVDFNGDDLVAKRMVQFSIDNHCPDACTKEEWDIMKRKGW